MNLRNVTVGFFVLVLAMFLGAPLALYLNARPAVAETIKHILFTSGVAIVGIVLVCIIVLAMAILVALHLRKRSSTHNTNQRAQRLPAGYVVAASPVSRRFGLQRFIRPEKTTWF